MAAERGVLTRRSAAVAFVGRCSAFFRCFAAFGAVFLRRCCRMEQPRGSLRRPRRDRGIASSPYSLLGFSSHPFVPPPLRCGVGGGRAVRSYAALCRWGKWFVCCSAFCLCGFCGGILVPLLLEGAALWQPPAAKEGQGDCDFPLGPPWILLYPLKRRRSAEGLEAAERRVLTRRTSVEASDGLLYSVRSAVTGLSLWRFLAPPLAAAAALWLPPAAKEG